MTSPQDPEPPQPPEPPGETSGPASRPEPAGDPQTDPPPAPAPPPPPGAEAGARRLTRSTSDRMLGGVAGGLGRYFGIDPIIFRVVFVVLLFAGAVGALAYVALWLLVPDDSPGARPPAGNSRGGLIAAGAILVVLALIFSGGPLWFFGPGLLLVGLITAGIVALVLNARGEGGDATKVLLRTMAVLGSLAAAAVLALVGGLAAAAGGGVAVAAVLIAAGLVLLVGAFTGGVRWLILPALALAASAAFVAAADIELNGGIGEQRYRPATVSDIRDRYELGIGELVVDLSDVTFPAGETRVDLELGMGEARVIVPTDVCAGVIAEVGAGWAELLGDGSGGIDLDWVQTPPAPADVPRVLVTAEIGVGEIVVDDGRFLDRDGRRFRGFGREGILGGHGNERCLR